MAGGETDFLLLGLDSGGLEAVLPGSPLKLDPLGPSWGSEPVVELPLLPYDGCLSLPPTPPIAAPGTGQLQPLLHPQQQSQQPVLGLLPDAALPSGSALGGPLASACGAPLMGALGPQSGLAFSLPFAPIPSLPLEAGAPQQQQAAATAQLPAISSSRPASAAAVAAPAGTARRRCEGRAAAAPRSRSAPRSGRKGRGAAADSDASLSPDEGQESSEEEEGQLSEEARRERVRAKNRRAQQRYRQKQKVTPPLVATGGGVPRVRICLGGLCTAACRGPCGGAALASGRLLALCAALAA
jgi:hypothetical protein